MGGIGVHENELHWIVTTEINEKTGAGGEMVHCKWTRLVCFVGGKNELHWIVTSAINEKTGAGGEMVPCKWTRLVCFV